MFLEVASQSEVGTPGRRYSAWAAATVATSATAR